MLRPRSALWSRVVLLGVDEEGLLLTDFTRTRTFKLRLPSMEGVSTAVLENEASRFDGLMRQLNSAVFLQFTALARRGDQKVMARHVELFNSPLLRELAEHRAQSLSNVLRYEVYVSVAAPLEIASLEGKEKKEASEEDFQRQRHVLEEVSILIGDYFREMGGDVEPLSGPEVLMLSSSILNPDVPPPSFSVEPGIVPYSFSELLFRSEAFIDDEGVFRLGSWCFTVLLMDVMPFPVSAVMFASKLLTRFCDEALVNCTVFVEDQIRATKKLEQQRLWASVFSGKKSAAGIANAEKVKSVDEFFKAKAREGFKITRVFLSVLLWGRDKEELREKVSALRSRAAELYEGIGLFEERDPYRRLPSALVASLPGFASRSFDMLFSSSSDAARLLPLRGIFEGERAQPTLLFETRASSAAAWNPFSPAQNRWAGFIVGPTGSGKSFITNYLIASALGVGAFVAVLDMATLSSYEPLVKVLGGSFVPISLSPDAARINLFDLRPGLREAVGSKLMSLDAVLESMLLEPGQKSLEKELKGYLVRAVKRLYERFLVEEPLSLQAVRGSEEVKEAVLRSAEVRFERWIEYVDHYLTLFEKTGDLKYWKLAEMAQALATPNLGHFVQLTASDEALNLTQRDREIGDLIRRRLVPFVQGPASVLLAQSTNLFIDADLFCFWLGPIRERPELMSVVFLIVRDFIWRKSIYLPGEIPSALKSRGSLLASLQKRPKLIVYDEFHNVKDNEVIMRVLENDARQQRTLGIATYVVTQKIKDLVGRGEASLIDAAANKIVMRLLDPVSPSMEELEDVTKVLGLDEEKKALLSSLGFLPGRYAECFLMSEGQGSAVLVYRPTAAERWLFTTHKDERALRDRLVSLLTERGIDERRAYALVLRFLSKEMPQGAVGVRVDADQLAERFLSETAIS